MMDTQNAWTGETAKYEKQIVSKARIKVFVVRTLNNEIKCAKIRLDVTAR